MKIMRRFFTRSPLDRACDPDLAFQLHPVKREGRAWICFELFPFFTRVVRKKNKAPLIEFFEQHDPDRGFATGRGSGETHRIRIGNTGASGASKPDGKLPYWVGVE